MQLAVRVLTRFTTYRTGYLSCYPTSLSLGQFHPAALPQGYPSATLAGRRRDTSLKNAYLGSFGQLGCKFSAQHERISAREFPWTTVPVAIATIARRYSTEAPETSPVTQSGIYNSAIRCGSHAAELQKRENQKWERTQQLVTARRPLPSAADLLAPVLEGKPFTVTQVHGRGRGLVATRYIPRGEMLHEERPLLAFPDLAGTHGVCYHCLSPLALSPHPLRRPGTSGRRLCSDDCLAAAWGQYLAVEEAVVAASSRAPMVDPPADVITGSGPLQALFEQCVHRGERFPLMASRLAFMKVAETVREVLGSRQQGPRYDDASDSFSPSSTAPSSSASEGEASAAFLLTYPAEGASSRIARGYVGRGEGRGPPRGDPLRSMHILCFANVTPPYPLPWLEQHGLLVAALQALAADPAALRSLVAAVAAPPPIWGQSALGGGGGAQAHEANVDLELDIVSRAVATVVSDALDEDWFAGVMSRLHLNVFQVHNPVAGADPSDLAAAAAALVAGTAGGGSAGSAAFLLASLFNHSCEPSLDLSFPRLDAAAAFTAARDIEPGEELCVSYLDVGLPLEVRQRHLEWSYGFGCECNRCKEEMRGAAIKNEGCE